MAQLKMKNLRFDLALRSNNSSDLWQGISDDPNSYRALGGGFRERVADGEFMPTFFRYQYLCVLSRGRSLGDILLGWTKK